LFFISLLTGTEAALAQTPQTPGSPLTLPNAPQRDTNTNKTNTKDWQNYSARLSYKYLNSEKIYTPDTSLHTFHRRTLLQPWYRNLGNHGGPVMNLMFTPEYRVGPSLGYHVFDVYRYNVDSLKYYNTNRAYSVFAYQMGSKQEQTAEIMHTQNIKPNWNFAVAYRKITSPGFYQVQRTNHDNAWLSTNYQSRNQHYELYGAIVYNKEQNDENGGIVLSAEALDSSKYSDRQTIRTRFYNSNYGSAAKARRSPIANTMRDVSIMVQHSYTFGRTDTTYNADSTSFRAELTPRFRITHRIQYSSEKHQYSDMRPDSLNYVEHFRHKFSTNPQDTLFTRQEWEQFDNRLSLNSFIGKRENQLQFSAGVGMRTDNFLNSYIMDRQYNNVFSNYITGSIGKEALDTGQWFYSASAMFFITGESAGSSTVKAELGKDLGNNIAILKIGMQQDINVVPYSYTIYQSRFDTILTSFNKESITQLYGSLDIERLKLYAGIRSFLISNYIYMDSLNPAQYAPTFNITQVWLRKIFAWRSLVFDNEGIYQLPGAGAPVNIPMLMGRHQLSIERYIFKKALKVATGVEIRYHSPYKPSGYSPYFNRFYYSTNNTISNTPETSIFFNFKVKRFRAYIMADQFQQLFSRNIITTTGYPGQNMMIRFGFNWVMIN
jgi:hypothetical protein